ncbi:NIPSNAP family protein [Rathayibacter sp. VKM Ac-2929]|uniref:NIPSNAP family protein n=1 Tax=Rathayibacter sp. VKM Ac-2929 TaxID=2929480 RepID=UPI001FB5615C|nr:NIPSNAP family protein [Rathayibacter sp. VKM Ac-2929]MCJ1675541.1 NIPSNAP family protein [Rathayibacter sp. VKM Ac-2929]
MLEIRTYTLASDEALEQYADVHWARHISSLAAHGITTHHVWREIGGDQPRLIALVEYAAGADPRAVTATYMSSPEFRADMDGFAMDGITGVSSVFVEPVSSDPTS